MHLLREIPVNDFLCQLQRKPLVPEKPHDRNRRVARLKTLLSEFVLLGHRPSRYRDSTRVTYDADAAYGGYRDESENRPQYPRHLRRLETVADDYPIQIIATHAKSSWIKFIALGLSNTSMGGTTASAEDGVSHCPR